MPACMTPEACVNGPEPHQRVGVASRRPCLIRVPEREVPLPEIVVKGRLVVLDFETDAVCRQFRRWLLDRGGWASFGDWLDSQP